MILFFVMPFQILVRFLQGLSINSTNEAPTFLIALDLVSFVAQLGKGIDKNTTHNIPKKGIHENCIE